MKSILYVTLGVLLALTAYCGEISIDFNGNVKIHNAPIGKIVKVTPPKFVDENNILIGTNNRLWVPSCGMLESDSGTIELTLTALDWKAGNSQYLFYARQAHGNDVIMIQGRNASKLCFYLGKLPASLNSVETDIDWDEESSHVIKATWDRQFVALYIDGRLAGKTARTLNDLKWADPIWLGGVIWAPGDSESALDHFRLSDQSEFFENPQHFKNTKSANDNFEPLSNNIAKEEFRVVFLPGSQFKPDKSKSVEMTMDGLLKTYFLSEKDAPLDNHYIEVIWPARITANAIRIIPINKYAPISGTLSMKREDGSFQKIADLQDFGKVVEFAPVTTECLRFDFQPGKAGQIGIAELEVAGKANRVFLPSPHWSGYFLWPGTQAKNVNFFRREFNVEDVSKVTMAHFQLSVDDAWDLYVNGQKLGVGGFAVKVFDLMPHLCAGVNTIAVRAENFSGPAGLLAELTLAEEGRPLRVIATDTEWQYALTPDEQWFVPGNRSSSWQSAERSPSLATYAANMPYMIPNGNATSVFSVDSIQNLTAMTLPNGTCRGTILIQTHNKLQDDYGFRIILGEEAIGQNCDFTLNFVDMMPPKPTSQWQPGERIMMDFDIPIPSWAPHGPQPLRIVALNSKSALPVSIKSPIQIMVKRGDDHPEVSGTQPECRVELVNNQMRPVVNGEVLPPVIFALNSSFTTYTQLGSEERIPSALYRFTPAQCSLYVPEGMDADSFFENQFKAIDQQIRQVLRFHSKAKLLIPLNCRINFARSNPKESVMMSNGEKLMYSFSSDDYLQKTIVGGERIIRHMLQSDYAGAIAGFIISTGAGGETMFWGYGLNNSKTSRDNLSLGDFSAPAQHKFREYLRQRYGNDVQKLRIAWKNETVDFATACADIKELRRQDHFCFRNPANGCMAIDYWDFHSDSVADSVMMIAKAFKNASNGKSLIGCWGFYSFATYPAICLTHPGGLQHIGAMSLDKLLDSSDVDFFACIQGYSGVRGNTLLNTSMPYASMKRHRKLFIEEFDVRTFFVDLNKVADHHTTSEFETVNVMKRDFGEALSHGYAAWFCGFSVGNTGRAARGWFGSDVLVKLISEMNTIGLAMSEENVKPAAEVALFVNNRDIAAMDVMTAAGILNNAQKNSVYGRFRSPVNCEAIKSAGVPYDIYLLSDFSEEVVRNYKFIVMLHGFYMDKKSRQLIREICQRQKKQVLWLYAPGYVEKQGTVSPKNITDITGINVTESPEMRTDLQIDIQALDFTTHNLSLPKNPYTGEPIQIGPVFGVVDSEAKVIGRYRHNGQPALAIKNVNGMQSIYCALPLVTRELFIDLCKQAGIHVYTPDAMAISLSNRIIAVHAPDGCDTVVSLPQRRTILDLYSRKIISRDSNSFALKLLPREATLFYQGNDEEVMTMQKKLENYTFH